VGGFVSTNVPLEHWSYKSIDRLAGFGLIDGAMTTTKPVSRLEMARMITEAMDKAEQTGEDNEMVVALLERLEGEFAEELMAMGAIDGMAAADFAKPIEDPYAKHVYAEHRPDLENMRGDEFEKGSNYRLGFASRAKLFDTAAFYVHPEYAGSSSEGSRDVKLIEAYGKIGVGKIEIEVGKDSVWWGPGYHGSLIMSNNAEPFKMIKASTPLPVQLPWIFKSLGPFKAVWFLTELEKSRAIPEAKLTGMRVNFKPHPAVDVGLSRAIMFGGAGRPGLSLADYWDVFLATQENRPGKLDNNQLAGVDVSVLLPVGEILPARSVKLYGDFAAEDEAGGLPSNWGKLVGMKLYDVFKTGRTDVLVEYARNRIPGKPNAFYSHYLYTSGYTYRGRIIGHHMGTDASDLYLRVSHYLSKDLILGAAYDIEQSNLSAANQYKVNQLELDVTYFTPGNWELKGCYRFEDARSNSAEDNHIFSVLMTYNF